MKHWWMLGLSLILTGGCGREVATPSPARPAHTGALRFLALGDSYTIGESVAESQRWPVQLAEKLRASGIDMSDPQIIARTGWTTDELSAAIDAANPQGPYDLVGLLIGVNNQFRGRSDSEYRDQFVALLKRSIAFAGGKAGRVVVLSIPDWGVTPFAKQDSRPPAQVAAEIDRFNAINREETTKAGALYVDVTPISREVPKDDSLVADDGLHPSGKQYTRWADAVLPVVVKALR
jgi:lysophospholipase L1-like esterase